MGKTKLPFRLKTHESGFIYVRFRHAGVDYDRSTGTKNPLESLGKARAVYNSIVHPAEPAPPKTAIPFFPIAEEWLRGCEVDTETRAIYRGYVRLWQSFFRNAGFPDVHHIEGQVGAYCYFRAASVLRKTFRKELSALRSFVRFLVRKKVLAAEFPIAPPAELKGKRANPERKRTGKLLTKDEVTAILAHLPPRLQDYFIVLYETGLRPVTVEALEYGKHWMHALPHTLNIPEELDKTGYARTVPLTAAAHAALTRAAARMPVGQVPVIFGAHDRRKALATAARKAGLEGVTEYDFRHSRTTHELEAGGSLPGVAFLRGHTQVSTTAKYAKPNEAAAREVLERFDRKDDQ